MFNLEQAIAEWRRQMLAAGIKTPVPLDELESHLREEIERRTKSGRSEAEAFTTAVQKIGPAHAVQNEFEKVETTEEERKSNEAQIWFVAILGLVSLISGGFVLFNSEMTFGQRMSGLAAIATSILLAGLGRLSYRIFPVIRARRIRAATIFISASVPGIIWVWMFARFILPSHEFPFGECLTALLWSAFPPYGVWAGLAWGIETAARKKVAIAGS